MSSNIAFMGVENFHSWPDLVTNPAQRLRMQGTVAMAYGVGVLGGLIWGGWRGVLAGWSSAAALKYGMGTVVYWRQDDPAYRDVAKLTGMIALSDLIVAVWLTNSVLERRADEGRSAFGFAH